jgi:hypothetical protein
MGPRKNGYTHTLFIRGEPARCRYMVRVKVKSKGRVGARRALASALATRTNESQEYTAAQASLQAPPFTRPQPVRFAGSTHEVCPEPSAQAPIQSHSLESMDDSSNNSTSILLSVKNLLETLQGAAPYMTEADRDRYTKQILELSNEALKNISQQMEASTPSQIKTDGLQTFSSSACSSAPSIRYEILDASGCQSRDAAGVSLEAFRQLSTPLLDLLDGDLDDIFLFNINRDDFFGFPEPQSEIVASDYGCFQDLVYGESKW